MRMRSAGILNFLEKKWISQQTYSHSDYLQSNSFQPVEYMHVRLTTGLFYIMMIISALICIFENIWYKLQHMRKLKNSNSILLGIHDNNLSLMEKRYKIRSRLEQRRKLSWILSESLKNPEFLQNVKIRINRW